MPRLSIVIPALGDITGLETTLVSVLSNRPAASEVVVVLNGPYADPYQLTDEVRFVQAPAGSRWAENLVQGIAQCRASVVHWLQAGTEVEEGWTEAALRQFGKRQVGSVSPLVVDADAPERLVTTGVCYEAHGARRLAGQGLPTDTRVDDLPTALGPSAIAGFWRKELFDRQIVRTANGLRTKLADVDWALQGTHAGWQTRLEARSRVFAPAAADMARGFRPALESERLFWRNRTVVPGKLALLRHLAGMATEGVAGLVTPRGWASILGRTIGLCQRGDYHLHWHYLAEAHAGAQRTEEEEDTTHLRFDEAHARASGRHGTQREMPRRLAA